MGGHGDVRRADREDNGMMAKVIESPLINGRERDERSRST